MYRHPLLSVCASNVRRQPKVCELQVASFIHKDVFLSTQERYTRQSRKLRAFQPSGLAVRVAYGLYVKMSDALVVARANGPGDLKNHSGKQTQTRSGRHRAAEGRSCKETRSK